MYTDVRSRSMKENYSFSTKKWHEETATLFLDFKIVASGMVRAFMTKQKRLTINYMKIDLLGRCRCKVPSSTIHSNPRIQCSRLPCKHMQTITLLDATHQQSTSSRLRRRSSISVCNIDVYHNCISFRFPKQFSLLFLL